MIFDFRLLISDLNMRCVETGNQQSAISHQQ
jgi:hypothetical protein